MSVNYKRASVTARIAKLEQAIRYAHEYLEDGKHASWNGFQPLFAPKNKNGNRVPRHRDWIKNVFLPRTEKELAHSEKVLEHIDLSGSN